MEPEELTPFLLKYLKSQPENSINRYNFTLLSDQSIYQALNNDHNKHKQLAQKFMEAWMWLEHEGLVLPKPGQQGDWAYITAKGQRLSEEGNFEAYKQAKLFPSDLDPVLVREVRPLKDKIWIIDTKKGATAELADTAYKAEALQEWLKGKKGFAGGITVQDGPNGWMVNSSAKYTYSTALKGWTALRDLLN